MSKKVNITKVKTGSLAKLLGTLNGIVFFVFGIIFAITSTVAVISNNDLSIFQDVLAAVILVLLGVVVYPMIGFVFGWIYGGLLGLIWNAVLGTSGGLEIETEDVKA